MNENSPSFFVGCNCDLKENGTDNLQIIHLTVTAQRKKDDSNSVDGY